MGEMKRERQSFQAARRFGRTIESVTEHLAADPEVALYVIVVPVDGEKDGHVWAMAPSHAPFRYAVKGLAQAILTMPGDCGCTACRESDKLAREVLALTDDQPSMEVH